MALLTRTYTFTDGTTAYGSQVETEIANVVNTLNSLDAGSTTWTNIKVTTLLPQTDISLGGHKITNLGTPTTSGDSAIYPITASQISAGTITTTQIASNTITSSNIASSTITGSNIASSTITAAKLSLSAGDITQVQSSATRASSHGTDITNISITTTGGKVLLIASATIRMTGAPSSVGVSLNITQGDTGITGAVAIGLINSNVTAYFPLAVCVVDTPTAGTYTYKLSYTIQNGSVIDVFYYSLQAIELKA